VANVEKRPFPVSGKNMGNKNKATTIKLAKRIAPSDPFFLLCLMIIRQAHADGLHEWQYSEDAEIYMEYIRLVSNEHEICQMVG